MSYTSNTNSVIRKCDVQSIAMNPSGGLIGDAIAVNLSSRGYNVYDTQQSSTLFARLNMNELEVSSQQDFLKLKERGVDAYLFVRSSSGEDGMPENVTVRLNRTSDGKLLVGITWSNGWGGQQGSIADRTMRKNLAQAADEITKGLMKCLPCLGNTTENILSDELPANMEMQIYK